MVLFRDVVLTLRFGYLDSMMSSIILTMCYVVLCFIIRDHDFWIYIMT